MTDGRMAVLGPHCADLGREGTWFRFALIAIALLSATMALAQENEGDEQREREAYERQIDRGSVVAPAQGRLTAYFEAQHLPMWLTRDGATPAWHEMGPKVIQHSWGDMDNAGRTCALVANPKDPRILYAGARNLAKRNRLRGQPRPPGGQIQRNIIPAQSIQSL